MLTFVFLFIIDMVTMAAGELGAVGGHEARVGRHVVPLRWAHGGPLLREADDAVRAQDAHGPGRHPQELGAQGHLHLPPQLRGDPLIRRWRHRLMGRPGPRFNGPGWSC